MMKIRIDDIERDCVIMPAPPKSFYIMPQDGLYGFPLYVAISSDLTEYEASCGDIIVAPINCGNYGVEPVASAEIHTFLYVGYFAKLAENYFKEGYVDTTLKEAAEFLLQDFIAHDIPMDKGRIVEYIKSLK